MSIDVTVSGLNTMVDTSVTAPQTIIVDADDSRSGTISVTVSGLDTEVDATVATPSAIDVETHEFITVGRETYHGAYEVIPDTEVHVLPTADKVMEGDVTVREIPYYETSNVQGTTVYIGGN